MIGYNMLYIKAINIFLRYNEWMQQNPPLRERKVKKIWTIYRIVAKFNTFGVTVSISGRYCNFTNHDWEVGIITAITRNRPSLKILIVVYKEEISIFLVTPNFNMKALP